MEKTKGCQVIRIKGSQVLQVCPRLLFVPEEKVQCWDRGQQSCRYKGMFPSEAALLRCPEHVKLKGLCGIQKWCLGYSRIWLWSIQNLALMSTAQDKQKSRKFFSLKKHRHTPLLILKWKNRVPFEKKNTWEKPYYQHCYVLQADIR